MSCRRSRGTGVSALSRDRQQGVDRPAVYFSCLERPGRAGLWEVIVMVMLGTHEELDMSVWRDFTRVEELPCLAVLAPIPGEEWTCAMSADHGRTAHCAADGTQW